MNKLYICRGLPASGKSFWARQFVDERGFQACRVNRDDLRTMAHGGMFSFEREFFVLRAATLLISQALQYGYDVVSDDTNLQNYVCRQLVSVAAICGKEVEWVMFETPVLTCLRRDLRRPKPVGKDVILGMLKMIEPLPADLLRFPITTIYPEEQTHVANTPEI